MSLTLTQLRKDLFNIVDQAIITGKSVEIVRKDNVIKLVPEKRKNKLDNLKPHLDFVKGNSNDFVHIDWSAEWNEAKNL